MANEIIGLVDQTTGQGVADADARYAGLTHATDHSDGGSDEITVENLATSGASDTVPVSQGDGSLSMALLSKIANGTSNVEIASSGGDVTVDIAGGQKLSITQFLLYLEGASGIELYVESTTDNTTGTNGAIRTGGGISASKTIGTRTFLQVHDSSGNKALQIGNSPSASTANSDTNGSDMTVRGQDGGTHVAANPDGGSVILTPGAAGSGGTGAAGSVRANGNFTTLGNRIRNTTTVNAATYDLVTTDDILHVTYTGTGAVTSLTLPTAQTVDGRTIVIKDAGGNAGTNNITIDTEGSENIDGAATLVLSTNYASTTLYSDGSNWFVI